MKHNRPDIIIWDKQDMKRTVIDICAPLDFYVNNRQITKIDKYMLLVSELQQLHPRYLYQIVSIVIGAMGTISKQLPQHFSRLGIKEKDDAKVTRKLQKASKASSQNNEDLYEDVNWNCMNLDIISEVFKHIFTKHVSMGIWILKF